MLHGHTCKLNELVPQTIVPQPLRILTRALWVFCEKWDAAALVVISIKIFAREFKKSKDYQEECLRQNKEALILRPHSPLLSSYHYPQARSSYGECPKVLS